MPIIVSSPPVEIPSMDKDVLMTTTSVYEDISDEDTNAGRVATVCRVSCQESSSGALKGNEEIVETDETLVLDDELKNREMNIIWTLLTKIKEGNQTSLTASMVRDMKKQFPELSSERIFALFTWTIWMYERSGKHLSEERSLVPADRMECENLVAAVSDGEKSVSTRQASIPDLELDADWDPVLPTVNRSPVEQNDRHAAHVPVTVESEEAGLPVVRSGEYVGTKLSDMFPELYKADEEEFDFGD